MSIISLLEQQVHDQPNLTVFRLTNSQILELYEWLQQFHAKDLPGFPEWKRRANFLGRKIEAYEDAQKDNG